MQVSPVLHRLLGMAGDGGPIVGCGCTTLMVSSIDSVGKLLQIADKRYPDDDQQFSSEYIGGPTIGWLLLLLLPTSASGNG